MHSDSFLDSEIVSRKLFATLCKYSDHKFYFVEPRGNFGDQLLFRGAAKLATLAHLNYERIDYISFMKRDTGREGIVYIHGGGNFSEIYERNSVLLVKRALASQKQVIILGPQTYAITKEFLEKFFSCEELKSYNGKLYLFCREAISYNALSNYETDRIKIVLDHDTALNLSIKDLALTTQKDRLSFLAIRGDKESSRINHANIFEIWIDPILACKNYEEWLNLHGKLKRVVTNRLHSAILGHILGKEVTLLPNSYHKNRGVWEFSLKDRNVIWRDNLADAGKLETILFHNKLCKRLRGSRKANRLLYKLICLLQR